MNQVIDFGSIIAEKDNKGIWVYKAKDPSPFSLLKKTVKEPPKYPIISEYEQEFKDNYQKTLSEMIVSLGKELSTIFEDNLEKAETEPKYKVFVYGTLRDTEIRKKVFGKLIPSVKSIAIGEEKQEGEYSSIYYSKEHEVEGRLIELTETQLETLDNWEDEYHRHRVQLKDGGWVYAYSRKSKYNPEGEEIEKGRKSLPIGTKNKSGEVKQPDGSWKYEGDSKIKNYLTSLLKLNFNEQQKQYFEWQLKNAKVIQTTPLSEIKKEFPDLHLRKKYALKGCYENSSKVCIDNSEVEYVEGYISFHGIPIEHAWNKIGDKYFDVTNDMVHGGNLQADEYCKVTEIPNETLLEFISKYQVYNTYMGRFYEQQKKKVEKK